MQMILPHLRYILRMARRDLGEMNPRTVVQVNLYGRVEACIKRTSAAQPACAVRIFETAESNGEQFYIPS